MTEKHLIQGSPEWLAMRKNYIGGSNAPVIMNGIHFGRTPYQLWQEKLGVGEEQKDNTAMAEGRRMEPIARNQYQITTGILVEPEVVFHPTIKYMMASLDGLALSKDSAVEIKNAGEPDHATAEAGKVPDKYYPQLQHQLECIAHLGINVIDYFSYHKGKGVIVKVKRDEKYIKQLLKKEKAFWDMVVTFEMPPFVDADFRKRSESWIEKARIAHDYKQKLSEIKKLSDDATKDVVLASDGHNSCGGGFFFRKSVRPGAVNYKAIPELLGIDLETFRKDPVEMWRLTQKEA